MAYAYYRSVTIDESKCGTADSTDFPVTFTGTYAYLATVANGGLVQHASGYDIGFFADSALTTKLDWEMVTYTPTTGFLEAHFRVGTLSASTNGVVYLAYGDSGISTFQGNVAGTWDSYYKLVSHMGDGTTIALTDSTANGQNGSNTGAVAATGQVGGAISTNGSSTLASWGRITALDGATYATIEAWIYRSATSVKTIGTRQDAYARFGFGWGSTTTCTVYAEGGANSSYPNFPAASTGWHHLVIGYDGSQATAWNRISAIWDGAPVTLTAGGNAPGTTLPSANTPFVVGKSVDHGSTTWGAGSEDELRVSVGIVRSASWALASFNNQSSPSTFYAVGTETAVGGGGGGAGSGYYSGYYYPCLVS